MSTTIPNTSTTAATTSSPPRPSWPPLGGGCSDALCSVSCPQWCTSFIFPTPPPFEDSSPSGPSLSPLVIAVIVGIITSFILLAAYALIFRRRRRQPWRRTTLSASAASFDTSHGDNPSSATAVPAAAHVEGLDESLINRIAACRYRRADGLVGGTECAVCLMEFGEGESLRLLPECAHAFHIPCIDTWLKAHSNCPVCRTGIVWANPAVEERVVVVVDGTAELAGAAQAQRASSNTRNSSHS